MDQANMIVIIHSNTNVAYMDDGTKEGSLHSPHSSCFLVVHTRRVKRRNCHHSTLIGRPRKKLCVWLPFVLLAHRASRLHQPIFAALQWGQRIVLSRLLCCSDFSRCSVTRHYTDSKKVRSYVLIYKFEKCSQF